MQKISSSPDTRLCPVLGRASLGKFMLGLLPPGLLATGLLAPGESRREMSRWGGGGRTAKLGLAALGGLLLGMSNSILLKAQSPRLPAQALPAQVLPANHSLDQHFASPDALGSDSELVPSDPSHADPWHTAAAQSTTPGLRTAPINRSSVVTEKIASEAPAPPDVGILYFTQSECAPCRQMAPMIDHLIGQGFPIQKVDVARNPELARQWQITATPTLVSVKEGQTIDQHSGIATAHQVSKMLIDAGYDADLNVLTKPTTLSPIVNFLEKIRPGRRLRRGQTQAEPGENSVLDPTASIPVAELSDAERAALAATVRIKVNYQEDGRRVIDFGTGTIIHRHENDILILTCGHVFRDSQGQAEISVDLGFSGGDSIATVPAHLLLFDAGAPDVAIVAASTDLPVPAVPIASPAFEPTPQMPTFCVGCDHGEPATVRRGNYLSTSLCSEVHAAGEKTSEVRAKKFDISGRPVVGRSGGGLFTADGALIGVCNAAVIEDNQGVYSSIDNVVAILEKAKLATLFQAIQGQQENQDTAILAGHSDERSAPGTDFVFPASNVAALPPANIPNRLATQRPPGRRFVPVLDGDPGASDSFPEAAASEPELVVMIPDANQASGRRMLRVPATPELLQQIEQAQTAASNQTASRGAAVPSAPLEIHRLPNTATAPQIRAQSPK